MNKKLFVLVFAIFAAALAVQAQSRQKNALTQAECDSVSNVLTRILQREVKRSTARVVSSKVNKKGVTITVSSGFSFYPFREDNVKAVYDSVRAALPARKGAISLVCNGRAIEKMALRSAASDDKKYVSFVNPSATGLVTPLSRPHTPDLGLAGRHIALWNSHGRYFDQNEDVWRWQRPYIWQTCEDLLTSSFVLQYLVPMLENAGANVFVPRERDINRNEIIADNDGGGVYSETNGRYGWYSGGTGFARKREYYLDGENPFADGTFRAVATVAEGRERESRVVWGADIPARGEYAVYVSYGSVKNGCDDATYTVHHAGGESTFRIDQTMGGGTWVYLGHFLFEAGRTEKIVSLTNRSAKSGRTVTADAVKIGGGYGNIARVVCDSLRKPHVAYEPVTSGMPRFCEGARYWLQWAGFSEEVYSKFKSKDDYKDDYTSRAHWVNALMGGSQRLPNAAGLRIPIDMALAFHTDSGITDDETVIGTLGIYCTKDDKGLFPGGASRQISRDLTDRVMSSIVNDIRATYEPNWVRRGMLNQSYYEARVPKVPTMLLELLSHQNSTDMRYGADPRFRFVVARAIYKAILEHLALQYRQPYAVAPLPVDRFGLEMEDNGSVRLSWHGVEDPLEASAKPESYIVYTRIDDGGFDNGRMVKDTVYYAKQEAGRIYSYRVTAVNRGGESFPSETLAACRVADGRGRVLVVNGFNRVSAPESVRNTMVEGFMNYKDSGVPYIRDISFVGRQKVFDPARRRDKNEEMALGTSFSDFEGCVVGGNTFDYPYMHGSSIVKAGYSFCSASSAAVDNATVDIDKYDIVDYISGKQRLSTVGNGFAGYDFRVFTPATERALRRFADNGGSIFVSGSNIASDIWTDNMYGDADKSFAREVLHYEFRNDMAVRRGAVSAVNSTAGITGSFMFHTEPVEESYCVESADVLMPWGSGAFAVLRYDENTRTAGVAFDDGDRRTVAIGFPFETITTAGERDRLMKSIMDFLSKK